MPDIVNFILFGAGIFVILEIFLRFVELSYLLSLILLEIAFMVWWVWSSGQFRTNDSLLPEFWTQCPVN